VTGRVPADASEGTVVEDGAGADDRPREAGAVEVAGRERTPTRPEGAPTRPEGAPTRHEGIPVDPEAVPFDPVAVGTEIQRRLGVKTVRGEVLARFTTMRVGGPADLYAVAHNAFELRGLVRFARARGFAFTLLGRGSDVVISDRGIRGLVIGCHAEGVRIDGERLVGEAGLAMARAATVAQGAGLSGLEFGLAIPGTLGGAVWANAGAHDADMAAVLESATLLLADGREVTVPAAELALGYRHSRIKVAPDASGVTPPSPPEVVLGATVRLTPEEPAFIRARLDDIRRWRQAHQPLGIPSAGSVFRNPPGTAAGRIIDELGLKGLRVGGASVSEKHANFVVNDRRGTAADVRTLVERVAAEVEARTGSRLQLEIEFLGDWAGWPWPEDGR
jgi:UDP-N-acetylmuramate dehydrogenase